MKRLLMFCASALTLVAATRPAAAQTVTRDDAGFPMRIVSVTLDRGATYQFRTDYALTSFSGTSTVPDSVLSLRNGPTALATTVAGSDGCATAPDGATLQPSCFSYTVPGTPGTGTVTHYLYLRAWRTATAGQTRLWMRRGADAEVEAGTSGLLTFGGATTTRSLVSSTRLLMLTTFLPGPSYFHAIWSSAAEWQVVRIDQGSGRIAGTALLDVPDRAAANLSGSRQFTFGTILSASGGPLRLIENDYYVAGKDSDGDGLSLAVEQRLKTCDRASQVNGTFRCDTLPGCGAPASALCLASLRDTDHDGLRDDLEVFGYNQAGLYLSRYGADPAHMDVFVELDTYDQDPDVAGCQTWTAATVKGLGGDTSAAADFFADADAIYGQAPARLNPDGQTGIRVHYDVGITNPDFRDTRWGHFSYGGTCVPNPACGYGALWEGGYAECPSEAFPARRKWVFRYGIDGTGGGGQANGLAYVAGHASHHVHELGHLAKLGHSGPLGTTAEHGHDNPNYRPSYPSRMNYLFQDTGGTTASNKTVWAALSFSDGSWNEVGLMQRFVSERCPLPHADLSKLSPVLGMLTVLSSGCWDADWNRNGVIDTAPTFMKDAFAHGFRHHRWTRQKPLAPVRSTPGVAVVNGVLLQAYAAQSATGNGVLTFRADGDGDCTAFPLPVSTPMIDAFVTAGSYPGCIKPGVEISTGVHADAVAVTPARLSVNANVDGAIVVWADGNTLRWGRLTISPASNASESWSAFVNMGVIAGSSVMTSDSNREPALVRMPGTNTVLLVYRTGGGQLVARTLAQGAASWSAAQVQLRADGTQVPAQAAVSLVAHGSDVLMAVNSRNPVTAVERLEVYAQATTGTPIEARPWTLDSVPYALPIRMRPSIASTLSIESSTRRDLYVHFVIAGGWIDFARTAGDRTVWTYEGYMPGVQMTATGPATVYDDRVIGANWGLRVFRQLPTATCTVNADCAGVTGAPVCNTARGFCSDMAGGDPFAQLVLEPFADGPEPGVYTDYDDWTGMKWGFCSSLQDVSGLAPSTVDAYNPRAYSSGVDCGPIPTYVEP